MVRLLSRERGLAALRRTTNNFIANDPTTIELVTTQRFPDGAGGYDVLPDVTRPAQEFKLIAVTTNLDGLVPTEGASSRNWTYVLLGRYDAEGDIGDTWTDGDTTYRITGLMHDNGYEKRWSVVAFGVDPNYG